MDTSPNVVSTAEPAASTSDNKTPSLTAVKKRKRKCQEGKIHQGTTALPTLH